MSSRWRWPSTSDRPGGVAAAIRATAFPAVFAAAALLGACGVFASKPAGPATLTGPAPGAAIPAAASAAPAVKLPPAPPRFEPVVVRPATSAAFSHEAHLGRGVGCTDCHVDAETKDSAGMPTIEGCMECHEEIEAEAPPEKKIAQFTGKDGKALWNSFVAQSDEIRFSHSKHLAKKVECASCHRGIEKSTRTDVSLRLVMDDCMRCHDERKAPNDCKVCHQKTGKDVPPANHVQAWRPVHGAVASLPSPRGLAEDCSLCHEPKQCVACHQTTPPTNHTPAFRQGTGHGAAYATTPAACAVCHDLPVMCADCHVPPAVAAAPAAVRRTGFAALAAVPQSASFRWTPGTAFRKAGDPGRVPQDHTKTFRTGKGHGAAYADRAQRCATCHVEPDWCSSCHAVTPPADHAGTWATSAAHGIASQNDRERCAMCHQESTCLSCHRDDPPRDHSEYWRTGPGHGLAASMGRERCETCHTTDECTACHTTNPPKSHRGSWGSPRNRHCLGCHEDSLAAGQGGCATCHQGAPSHRLAPPKPDDHRPDFQCRLCHERLRHPINDQNCNQCHR